MSNKHFVEKIVSGYWAQGTLYKKSAPQAKNFGQKFCQKCNNFQTRKNEKNGIIRSKIIFFLKFKKLSRGIWPRIPHAKNQLPTLKIVGQSLWERKYDFHRKPEVVFEFDKNWKRNHFNLMQRQYIKKITSLGHLVRSQSLCDRKLFFPQNRKQFSNQIKTVIGINYI